MTKEKPLGLEEALGRLEAIVTDLETGEFTLEESLARFEEGLALGKHCRTILDRAELRVRRLIDVDEDGSRVEEDAGDAGE